MFHINLHAFVLSTYHVTSPLFNQPASSLPLIFLFKKGSPIISIPTPTHPSKISPQPTQPNSPPHPLSSRIPAYTFPSHPIPSHFPKFPSLFSSLLHHPTQPNPKPFLPSFFPPLSNPTREVIYHLCEHFYNVRQIQIQIQNKNTNEKESVGLVG